VVRDGKKVTLTVTTQKRPTEEELAKSVEGTPEGGAADVPGKETKVASLGLSVSSLTATDAQRLNIPNDVKGVLVTNFDFGGPAYDAGIGKGSVIIRVGRTPTPTVSSFLAAVKAAKPGVGIVMLVNVPSTTGARSTSPLVIKPERK
jgi:serine protease Do